MGLLRTSDPYAARSEEERQHNLARLGTRWQENRMRPRDRSWHQAVDVWRARDAYQAQTWLMSLGFLLLLVLGLVFLR